ncbi:MAG TPA: VOC family protein [Allosphingosinicella sp.]|nr:VOC family protein [Allosphingosinicella sp.]
MTDANSETLVRPRAGTEMLGDADAVANLAVKDLARAREFYEGLLGFSQVAEEGGELIVYKSGKTVFNVYRSDYAGTNQATAMTWAVGDRVSELAEALAAKGVKFEHYDMPGMRREGDVHIAGEMKVAWFKDPDGNILNIASG